MKTLRTRTDLDLAPARPTVLAIVSRGAKRLAGLYRAMRHRRDVMSLEDFTDQQLADIGLTRDDVKTSLAVAWYDDPSTHLTRLAWRRNGRRIYR